MRKKIVSLLLIGSILLCFNSNEIAKADSTNTGSALADTVTDGPDKTTYIPEDLLEFIEQNMNQGNERDSFSSMICDKELSSKDLDSYKNNASLKEYLDMLNDYSGLALKVDADNDGIEDLFFVIYDGGTMGNTSRYLLKGKADGTYSMTYSSFIDITQELAFITYQNTSYLLETTFDYNSKMYNGFELSYFKDGKKYEQVNLSKGAQDYTVKTTVKDKNLKKLADTCKTVGLKNYAYDLRYDKDDVILGTAEKKLTKKQSEKYAKTLQSSDLSFYSCDYDNDKKAEIYAKYIFYTSTISTVTGLDDFLFEPGKYKSYKEISTKYFPKLSGTPQMFWVEKTTQGNITCILSLDNLLDYTIYGYKITNGKAKEVFRDSFKAKPVIYREIYTKGINLEDDTDSYGI